MDATVEQHMENLEFAQKLLSEEPWLPTPLLPAQTLGSRLGIDLWLKREDCTPVGSFKIRGGLVTAARYADQLSLDGVYVASAGNYGLAIALAGQRHGFKVTVVVPEGATPSKVERIRACGADVTTHGEDFDSAKDFARKTAEDVGAAFWEDGAIEEMAWGAATIATEILAQRNSWDIVLIPLGNGSLFKGVATVFKKHSPKTRMIALVPKGAPSMAYAIRSEPWDTGPPIDTIADGLAVRVPIPEIVEDLKPLTDDIWLVDDDRLLPAVRTLMEFEQVMVEPSAAITIAALVSHSKVLRGQRVAAILTGAHLNMTTMMPDVLQSQPLV